MDEQVRLLRHVQGLAKKGGNTVCAECPERHPTWASLIKPAVKGGSKMGVFVCQRCYKHHFSLGRSICEVKSLSMATEWSKEEADILAKSGNKMVNSIYEARGDWDDDKEIITFDKDEESKLRFAYIKNKYAERQYFDEDKFNKAMEQLSPTYKKMMENRRNKQDAADVATLSGTPPSARPNRRRFSLTGGVNNDINPDILATPRKPKQEINPAIMATPMRRTSRPERVPSLSQEQPSEAKKAARVAIPETPRRNGARRRNSLVGNSNDAYTRSQQQSILAAGSANGLHDDDNMENDYLKTPQRRQSKETVVAHTPSTPSARQLLGLHQTPSDRSLRSKDEMNTSRRGRRGSLQVMERSSSSRSVQDRSQRRRSMTLLDRSASERDLSDGSGHDRSTTMMLQMPSALTINNNHTNRTAVEDEEGNLNRRRMSLRRGMMTHSYSDRDLTKSPRTRTSRTEQDDITKSPRHSTKSMRESRTSGMLRGDLDLVAPSPRSMRRVRSIDRTLDSSSTRKERIQQLDPSARRERTLDASARRERMLDSSARRERVLDSSSRGGRMVESSKRNERMLDASARKERTSERSSRKDRTTDASSRKERKLRHKSMTPGTLEEPGMDWSGESRKESPTHRSTRGARSSSRDDPLRKSDHDKYRKFAKVKKDSNSLTRRKTVASPRAHSPEAKSQRPKRCGTTGGMTEDRSDTSARRRASKKTTDLDGSGKSNSSDSGERQPGKSSSRKSKKKSSSNDKMRKLSHDPLRDSSHGRKSSKKGSSRARRHRLDGDLDDSNSSDGGSEKRSREDKKHERRQMRMGSAGKSLREVPSTKRMMRSLSTGELDSEFETDADSDFEASKNERRESSSKGMPRSQSAKSLAGKKKDDKKNGAKYKHLDNSVLSSGYSGGTLGLLMTNGKPRKRQSINDKAAAAAAAVAAAATAGRPKASPQEPAGEDKYNSLDVSLKKSGTTGTLGLLAMKDTPSKRASEVFGLKNFDYKNTMVSQWMKNTAGKEHSSETDESSDTKDKAKTKQHISNSVIVTPLMSMMIADNNTSAAKPALKRPAAPKRGKSSESPKSVAGNKNPRPEEMKHESFEDAIVSQWLKA